MYRMNLFDMKKKVYITTSQQSNSSLILVRVQENDSLI